MSRIRHKLLFLAVAVIASAVWWLWAHRPQSATRSPELIQQAKSVSVRSYQRRRPVWWSHLMTWHKPRGPEPMSRSAPVSPKSVILFALINQ